MKRKNTSAAMRGNQNAAKPDGEQKKLLTVRLHPITLAKLKLIRETRGYTSDGDTLSAIIDAHELPKLFYVRTGDLTHEYKDFEVAKQFAATVGGIVTTVKPE